MSSFRYPFLLRNLYPFHIAKCAVTQHWTPLSIHPLCCCYTPVCFHTECRISAFWRVRFKKRSKIEQKDIITPMHCLAFPSALFGAPFHIDNRTVANCGFWLEYASKTPLEVGADLPRRMRLFWLRCQIMRLRSVHIKPHYSQNAFDSALLAWYERGIIQPRNSHCQWGTARLSIQWPMRHQWTVKGIPQSCCRKRLLFDLYRLLAYPQTSAEVRNL